MMKPSSHTVLLLFFWFLILHFIVSFSFTVNTSSAYLCSYDQGRALMDFKNSFNINSSASIKIDFMYDVSEYMPPPGQCSPSSHPRTNSWDEGQDCCYWDGVTCDATTGEVIGLDLSCSWLQGQLSSNNSLFLLQHLQILNLAHNDFIGSEISVKNGLPSSIGNLRSIKYLNISGCGISGSIPDSIENLTSLEHFDLSYNNLVGPIPAILFPHKASQLTSLALRNNSLSGTIPCSLFTLPSLLDLDLSHNQLVGGIPEFKSTSLTQLDLSYNKLQGYIPSSISCLANLTRLILYENNLSGTIDANVFSNLLSLHTLHLGRNSLTGTIPFYLYSLPLLRFLYLSYNLFIGGQLHPFQSRVLIAIGLSDCRLQGPIPAILFPHGANHLIALHLRLNSLNGTIPSLLFTLPSLFRLDLAYNQLVGGIPEFTSTSLQEITLSSNKLQGHIPTSISGLVNLRHLLLDSNNLSGTIDISMFSRLQSLSHLYGSNNNLSFTTNGTFNHSFPNLKSFRFDSCNVAEFPTFLRGSNVLHQLDLSNNKIDGHVPDWLWDVGRDTLNYLNLAHNSLTGIDKLPWTQLKYLDLRSNLLRGPLPLPQSTLVTYFISNNSLTKDIPTLICNISSMEAFDISSNKFTGTIPECLGNISTLTVLDLSMNKFHGKIPNFSRHEKRRLRTLNLNGNQLEGKLPISLVNCENLEVLDIGNNAINDTFPHWLRFITGLKVLVLKSNHFHGYIDDYKYQRSFQKLRIFDVSNNNFVGSLPTKYIQGLEAMKQDMLVRIDGSNYMVSYYGSFIINYEDSVSLTIKGNEIKLERILTTFTTIDLSNNKFGDEISQVFGTLISLKSLNLSHNNLIGHIPTSIGNVRNLESLDLSSNKLSGTIPRELASVTFLGKLNLSQNALVGPIPSANNFDTRFENSSYQENLALCGPPLSRTCGNKNNKKPPPALLEEDGSDDFDKKIILYGYISGLVIGFSIGYIVLSGELPIWLVKMIQRFKRRKLKGQIQLSRGRN